MKKTLIMGLIAGVTTIAMISSMTLSVTSAFATSQCNNPPCDGWGQAAKDTIEATSGKDFGDHASNPPDLHPEKPGRDGIGNTAEELTGNKNPSDLGDQLSGSLP